MSKFSLFVVDWVSPNLFSGIISKKVGAAVYYILNYEKWIHGKKFNVYGFKRLFLNYFGDVFFILSLITYTYASGIMSYITFNFIMIAKLIFTFYYKKSFSISVSPDH